MGNKITRATRSSTKCLTQYLLHYFEMFASFRRGFAQNTYFPHVNMFKRWRRETRKSGSISSKAVAAYRDAASFNTSTLSTVSFLLSRLMLWTYKAQTHLFKLQASSFSFFCAYVCETRMDYIWRYTHSSLKVPLPRSSTLFKWLTLSGDEKWLGFFGIPCTRRSLSEHVVFGGDLRDKQMSTSTRFLHY